MKYDACSDQIDWRETMRENKRGIILREQRIKAKQRSLLFCSAFKLIQISVLPNSNTTTENDEAKKKTLILWIFATFYGRDSRWKSFQWNERRKDEEKQNK